MAIRTITSANAVLMLAIPNLFPVPRRIQGFGADGSFASQPVETVETVLGVDGILSAGWVPFAPETEFTIQADSESSDFFEEWNLAEARLREKYPANGTILITSIGREYTLERGFLNSVTIIPTGARVLQARNFSIRWQRIIPSPV